MNSPGTSSPPLVNPSLQETQHIEPEEPVFYPVPGSEPGPDQSGNAKSPGFFVHPDTSNAQRNPEPIIRLPNVPLRGKFTALQLFEGTVQEVSEAEFNATLRDQMVPSNPRQSATIAFDHVCDDDRDLVAPGAVFYWSIGYRIQPYGQRSLESNIRFRRLPVWTESELEKLSENEEEFSDFFDTPCDIDDSICK